MSLTDWSGNSGRPALAARNGTIIIYNLIIMVGKIQNPPIPMGGFCFKWVDFVSFLNTLIYFLIGRFYGILLF